VEFARTVEAAMVETVEAGVATGDLVKVSDPPIERAATLDEFMDALASRLRDKMGS